MNGWGKILPEDLIKDPAKPNKKPSAAGIADELG
jgi:hypothetical protein